MVFGRSEMIPIAEPVLGEEELQNIIDAVKSSWISSMGRFISEFENGFAEYCRVKYGVAVSNGTAALHLALKALGIERGDEVIIPALTFVATANTVTYCNAKPVFVDSHPDYWCIDPEKIEERINKNTRAIMPVHIYGHPCDMDAIVDIAEDYDLYVIEDAAEAHGAEYKGRKTGSRGNVGCFSFYGNKIITTGEGGMCVTSDEELAEKLRLLRDHAMSEEKIYRHDMVGFNYRMTNLQAAIGVAQIKKLEGFIEKKRKIAEEYKEGLKELQEDGLVKLHPEMPWAKCVYWMYSLLLEDRDKVMKELAESGIDTRPFFYPMHFLPPYKSNEAFVVAEKLSKMGINLPSSAALKKSDINRIVQAVSEALS
jgi:perosamine synthetase